MRRKKNSPDQKTLKKAALDQFNRLMEKWTFHRVYSLMDAENWFSKNEGDYVLCVNGKKTAIAHNLKECEIFYSNCTDQ